MVQTFSRKGHCDVLHRVMTLSVLTQANGCWELWGGYEQAAVLQRQAEGHHLLKTGPGWASRQQPAECSPINNSEEQEPLTPCGTVSPSRAFHHPDKAGEDSETKDF